MNMAQETCYKKSLTGTVGAGMKSLIGGSGRRYYILEHKNSSKFHYAGEAQKIIVESIEIGRDPKCQVRYDDKFSTVSRHHAAIVRDGEMWKLIHLSKTNPTFINGRKIDSQWYLQNGDEIQLSNDGPKLGFIIPQGDKSFVKNIGLTARMNLFGQQALAPYKKAIGIMACLLVLGCLAGGYYINSLYNKNQDQAELIAANDKRHKEMIDKQETLLKDAEERAGKLAGELSQLQEQFDKVKQKQREIAVAAGAVDNKAINSCLPNIYFIYTTTFNITLPNGEKGSINCGENGVPSWSGTGFLLKNGKFVTARHVVEGWNYWSAGGRVDENMIKLNAIANNGGKVVANFIAVSSSGKSFKMSSSNFYCDRSRDKIATDDEGYRISQAPMNEYDYAYIDTKLRGGLDYTPAASRKLKRGTKLTILGFPYGLGVDRDKVNPVYGSAIVSVDGLNNGCILTTDSNYEHGNSGGPAFYIDSNGKMKVVGIVSAGAGRNVGFIVPISIIK